MTLTIYTDGGSLNNPGEAASAYAFYLNNKLLTSCAKRIGIASNNVAEYTALIEAFTKSREYLKTHTLDAIEVFSDSLLMISQVKGLWKVKNATIGELLVQVRERERELTIPITYHHVLRGKNEYTDSLVKKALGR